MFNLRRLIEAFRLLRQAYGQYKFQILLLTGLGFLTGLLEAVGINVIIPIFALLTGGAQGASDFVTRKLEQILMFFNIPLSLTSLLIVIVALFLTKALALVFFNLINVRITASYERSTRAELLSNTLQSNWPYLLQQKIGHLEQVIVTDVARGAALLRHISGTILLVTNILMYVLVAINISPVITIMTLGIGLIVFLTFKPFFYKARMISAQQAALTKDIAHIVNEHMIGVKTVKAAAVEKSIASKANEYFEKLKKATVRASLIAGINNSLIEPIGIIFIVAVFAASSRLTDFNFAAFAVIIYLIQKIFSYLQIAQSRLQTISELAPYLGAVIKYQDAAQLHKEHNPGKLKFKFDSELRFENVGFAYGSRREILSKVNFAIRKGEMIGLIGPSGAGKTTLVDLLLRLFEPEQGKILLNGQAIQDIDLHEWRKNIGYVSQDMFLLNDTIENNIKFYDETLSPEAIVNAAKLANIYDFVQTLPDGLKANVGERGVLLSGGQKQRVILARSLARKPQLLILDEATSSLDAESETAIQQALSNLKGRITMIVIAHRLSTVMNCDKLVVIKQGRILEEGSPQTLRGKENSYFSKIYNLADGLTAN